MTITKNGTIPLMNKVFWSLTGALTAAVGSPLPNDLRELIWAVLTFTAVDTFLGVYVAWRFKEVESRKFIEKISDKAVLFIVVGLAAYVGAALVDSWVICKGAAGVLIFYEASSIVESFKKLAGREKNPGVLVALIEKLTKGFAEKGEGAGVTVQSEEMHQKKTTVTVTPSDDKPVASNL